MERARAINSRSLGSNPRLPTSVVSGQVVNLRNLYGNYVVSYSLVMAYP